MLHGLDSLFWRHFSRLTFVLTLILPGVRAFGAAQQTLAVRQTSPGWVIAGSGPQNVWIVGNFTSDVVAVLDGQPHAVTYLNAHALLMPLTKADQAAPALRVITLTESGGGTVSVNLPVLLLASDMMTNSQLAAGNEARMQSLIEKGRAGKTITIAAIGGSITAGSASSNQYHAYVGLLQVAWHRMFPASTATIVNAGITATSSDYGSLRVARDVLAHNPDLVIVEFAVNDRGGGVAAYGDTYEGLVRQLLDAPNHPAVILLMLMSYLPSLPGMSDTAQAWQAIIGQNYDLPMVSYHDAIAPEILNGDIPLSLISAADETHPTDFGHAYIALFLQTALENAGLAFPSGAEPDPIPATPPPLISDRFEYTRLMEGVGSLGSPLAPTDNNGWAAVLSSPDLFHAPEGFESSVPGSTLDFTVNGTDILVNYWMCNGPMGQVQVSVDGVVYPAPLDGWESGPGQKREVVRIATGLDPGDHQVHVELLSDHSPESAGTTFRLLSIGTATSGANAYASATLLSTSSSTISYSSKVTLTATVIAVARGASSARPSGTVQFYIGSDSGILLGSGPITSSCSGVDANPTCSGVATLDVSGSSLQPGANNIVAYFEGDAFNDTPSTSAAQSVFVNSVPQNLTFNGLSPVTYGVSPTTLSATSDSGLAPAYQVISGPGSISGTTLTITGAGQVLIEADQAGDSTYAAATPVQQLLTVDKADASCSVTGYSVAYDGTAHIATGSCTGVNSEPLSVVPKGHSIHRLFSVGSGLDVSQTTHTDPGIYNDSWTLDDLSGNYNNQGGIVTDTINKATLLVTAANRTMTYGTPVPALAGTLSGAIASDGITASYSTAVSTGVSAAATTANVGTYAITAILNDPNLKLGNYTLTVTGGTLTVNKANAHLVVTRYVATYDGNDHFIGTLATPGATTAMATGALGDDLSAGLNLTSTHHTDAGSYTDSWTFHDLSGNYNDIVSTKNDVVNQAMPTFTKMTGFNGNYDAQPHGGNGNATGIGSLDLSAGLSFTKRTNAGSYYGDAWTFNDPTPLNSNAIHNYKTVTGLVNDFIHKVKPIITNIPYSVTYDGNLHNANVTVVGVAGETADLSLGLTLPPAETNAGVYNTSAQGSVNMVKWAYVDQSGNYLNASGWVNFTIAKAPVTFRVQGYNAIGDGSTTFRVVPGTSPGHGVAVVMGAINATDGVLLQGGFNLSATVHGPGAISSSDPWSWTDPTGNYKPATTSGTVNDVIR